MKRKLTAQIYQQKSTIFTWDRYFSDMGDLFVATSDSTGWPERFYIRGAWHPIKVSQRECFQCVKSIQVGDLITPSELTAESVWEPREGVLVWTFVRRFEYFLVTDIFDCENDGVKLDLVGLGNARRYGAVLEGTDKWEVISGK